MVRLMILWSGLLALFLRGVGFVHAVRDHDMLPGPAQLWASGWINVPASIVNAEDVAHWPCSVGVLVKWVAFLGSLHCPVGGAPMLRC